MSRTNERDWRSNDGKGGTDGASVVCLCWFRTDCWIIWYGVIVVGFNRRQKWVTKETLAMDNSKVLPISSNSPILNWCWSSHADLPTHPDLVFSQTTLDLECTQESIQEHSSKRKKQKDTESFSCPVWNGRVRFQVDWRSGAGKLLAGVLQTGYFQVNNPREGEGVRARFQKCPEWKREWGNGCSWIFLFRESFLRELHHRDVSILMHKSCKLSSIDFYLRKGSEPANDLQPLYPGLTEARALEDPWFKG